MLQTIYQIIVLSSMYALLGVGFVTIYRAGRVLNFAYADFALLIAYLAVLILTYFKGMVLLPIALVFALSFTLGILVYRLLIRPMIGESLLSTILVTVALGIIINSLVVLIWQGNVEVLSLGWRKIFKLPLGIFVNSTEIITLGSTILLLLGLWVFFKFARIGRQMRAISENLLLSAQRGVNIYLITSIAWGIGIFVTGVAGVLFGANYGVSLHMGNMVVKGLAVALVGGLDSLIGVIPAAILISAAEKLATYYINPRLADAIPFIFMLIVLIIKPWGILGTEEEIERV